MVSSTVHVVATIVWLLLGIATITTILDLFGGKTGADGKDRANRRHRVLGAAFVALYLLLLASMCVKFVRHPASSATAAIHGVLAIGLLPLLVLKVGIVRRWSTLQRFLPALGMSVFSIAFVVGATGLLMAASERRGEAALDRAGELTGPAGVAEGRPLVARWCSRCHSADRVYASAGRKTRSEWTATFGRMASRDPALERVRGPVLAFLHAELASDAANPAEGATPKDAAPPTPTAPDDRATPDDRGRGRGRGDR